MSEPTLDQRLAGKGIEAVRLIRDQIRSMVDELLAEITAGYTTTSVR
ncbi:hypothetical protein [Williamsia muralis]|uniref:Uncharacterized protein n=1 Tax=Williamsia marianensis TaxID=85044 RepID=A0ABU4F3F3_WILMA|nr:hypothetical protein [Williamsia muralis]MDV7136721.1 hypothetical protein [Williamsia muralis]